MPTSSDILEILKEEAAEFNFPVLDNAYWRLVAGRVRGFRKADDWALVFEVLVYQTQASEFSVEVYGYGSLVGDKQGFLDAVIAVEEMADYPLWDDEGEWVCLEGVRAVSVYGESVSLQTGAGPRLDSTPWPNQRVVISHGDEASEAAFARALVRELGLQRLMPDVIPIKLRPQLRDAIEVIRLTNWDHPDIAGEQTPSDSQALLGCAQILGGEATAISYSHANDNVDSQYWDSRE